MTVKKESIRSRSGTGEKKKSAPKTVVRQTAVATGRKKSAGKKPVAAKKPSGTTGKTAGPIFTAEERHQMIAEAAYYHAERRGFKCRCCERDWFDAVAEIDRIMKSG